MQKDWQSARFQAWKEQEEKQLEQDDDQMMYTYARDNEQKVKYNYPYSSAQSTLVVRSLRHREKSFAVSHSPFCSPLIPISKPPLSPSPPFSPVLVQHSSRTIDTHSQAFDNGIQRNRLQIVPSPPLPGFSIRARTPFPLVESIDDSNDSPVSLRLDVDLHQNCRKNTSKVNTKSAGVQPILIVNSLQSLNSLSIQSVITFANRKSILKPSFGSNIIGQASSSKSTNPP